MLSGGSAATILRECFSNVSGDLWSGEASLPLGVPMSGTDGMDPAPLPETAS
jgi:hypothetical protein